jgi:hypothetical protein
MRFFRECGSVMFVRSAKISCLSAGMEARPGRLPRSLTIPGLTTGMPESVLWGAEDLFCPISTIPCSSTGNGEIGSGVLRMRSYGMTMGALDTYASYTVEMNHAGSFIRISEDGAQTWGAPIKVPVSSPHGPISAGDGRLLWLGKEMYSGLPEGERESILLMESRDSGKSWSTLSEIAVPEGLSVKNLHEPHLAALPDGGAIRVEGEAEPVEGGTIYLCHSGDGGRTWSVPTATGLRGLPPHLLPRADGSVLCTYARRIPPFGIRAVILRDMGRSIREELVIDEVSELQYAGDLGYPATVELDDGSYVTVYYRIVDGDGKPSIVYTKWKATEGGKT